jgi:glutathione S-transferase
MARRVLNMSEFVVYGIPGSPYLRSALLGLQEKNTAYRLAVLGRDIGPARGAEHLERHPFGRIPILEHGDFRLYETQAILRYLDATLPGIALQPQDARALARMSQIAGIVDWYVWPSISVGITAERCMSQRIWNRPPSEANIAQALPGARLCLQELQRLQGSAEFLAGDRLSLADLMVAPQLQFFRGTPEAQELMQGTALDNWLKRMHARPSMQATELERLQQAA